MNSELDALVVVGMGYVGTHLALAAARAGIRTIGVDSSQAVVDSLQRGVSRVDGVSADEVREALAANLSISGDVSAVRAARTVVITVPTPLNADGAPDHGAVLRASAAVAAHVQPQTLICLESTVGLGTTDGPVRRIFDDAGLELDEDYFLAFAPERINPGDSTYALADIPRVVGGVSNASVVSAARFYKRFVNDVIVLRSSREAELAKLIENTYRYINLAFMNELSSILWGSDIDVVASIEAAATKPYGFAPFYPGPGVGGHCIPVDPVFLQQSLLELAGASSSILGAAHQSNGIMPQRIYARFREALLARRTFSSVRVGLVGVGYKGGVRDTRNSPATTLARLLLADGNKLSFYDDEVDTFVVDEIQVPRVQTLPELVSTCDVVIRLQLTKAALQVPEKYVLIDLRSGQDIAVGEV